MEKIFKKIKVKKIVEGKYFEEIAEKIKPLEFDIIRKAKAGEDIQREAEAVDVYYDIMTAELVRIAVAEGYSDNLKEWNDTIPVTLFLRKYPEFNSSMWVQWMIKRIIFK